MAVPDTSRYVLRASNSPLNPSSKPNNAQVSSLSASISPIIAAAPAAPAAPAAVEAAMSAASSSSSFFPPPIAFVAFLRVNLFLIVPTAALIFCFAVFTAFFAVAAAVPTAVFIFCGSSRMFCGSSRMFCFAVPYAACALLNPKRREFRPCKNLWNFIRFSTSL